jgi:tetratricopeptide (TPR) repeat protein
MGRYHRLTLINININSFEGAKVAQRLSSRPRGQQTEPNVLPLRRMTLPGKISIASALRGWTSLVTARTALVLLLMIVGIAVCGEPSWAQAPSAASESDKAAPDPVVLALTRARESRAKGEFNEALRIVDKALESTPRDLQLRFMKGLIFSDQAQADPGKRDQAITVFEALTQDYPEVGEPHNNLAVLLAGKGELEKARYALERAILAQPNYALAYENLGDIYLRLAEKSYGEANVKSPSSKSAKAKLDQAREWVKGIEK